MKNIKYFIAAAGCLTLLGSALLAQANPRFFSPVAQTAAATTTTAYMTPGTGTSTLVYDSYHINSSNPPANTALNTLAASQALLLVQFSASSSAAQLNINFEYSQDNVDWYSDTYTIDQDTATTTTSNPSLSPIPQLQWTFATSTLGGAPAGNLPNAQGARATRAVLVRVPARYERAVFSCAIGGANCAVWAQYVPQKEQP